jgi:hypothetical protein
MAVNPGGPVSPTPQASLRPGENSHEDTARRYRQLRGRNTVMVKDAGYTRRNARQALVPPNPKELLIATAIATSRASLGT